MHCPEIQLPYCDLQKESVSTKYHLKLYIPGHQIHVFSILDGTEIFMIISKGFTYVHGVWTVRCSMTITKCNIVSAYYNIRGEERLRQKVCVKCAFSIETGVLASFSIAILVPSSWYSHS